jgi:S-adenosylmethionine:tRNA ribosyltransferase-isomerase
MTLLKQVQSIQIEDYDYPLDESRIAKHPVEPRDSSKLLLYRSGTICHDTFRNLPAYLPEKSLLVYNNTKVIHARMIFHKDTGAKIELFCLEPLTPADYAQNFQSEKSCEWMCLIGNSKKWKQGDLERELYVRNQKIIFRAERLEAINNSYRVRFTWDITDDETGKAIIRFEDLLDAAGKIPIPPYLNRDSEPSDETDYQTVYSRIDGSVAAPTAGLHFTPEVLADIDKKNILRREVTLHVGAGTFRPVQSQHLIQHSMHSEFISVEKSLIRDLINNNGHVVAVGTTSVRTLESLYWFGHKLLGNPNLNPDEWDLEQWYVYKEGNEKSPKTEDALQAIIDYLNAHESTVFTGSTRLLIAPGYTFRVVNAMLTNFHQPKSTLLLLVSAFIGGEKWKDIYKYALSNNFRFLSYGDSSLLMPSDSY